jgi:hypothetical protein
MSQTAGGKYSYVDLLFSLIRTEDETKRQNETVWARIRVHERGGFTALLIGSCVKSIKVNGQQVSDIPNGRTDQ